MKLLDVTSNMTHACTVLVLVHIPTHLCTQQYMTYHCMWYHGQFSTNWEYTYVLNDWPSLYYCCPGIYHFCGTCTCVCACAWVLHHVKSIFYNVKEAIFHWMSASQLASSTLSRIGMGIVLHFPPLHGQEGGRLKSL